MRQLRQRPTPAGETVRQPLQPPTPSVAPSSGLTGSGLVLQNNGGDDLAISANGSFIFTTPITNGASYAVTVKSQPRVPGADLQRDGRQRHD